MIVIGTDIVCIPSFAQQLDQPGTQFDRVFSAQELRVAARYQGRRRAEHLAGRWAAKEAFVKAWSQSLYGKPPVLEHVDWAEIEVQPDAWGRVLVVPRGEAARACGIECAQVSISHDENYAMAQCVLG
ncbi:holo-ACP synthase [Corynebacterium diphtheriae]|nr:holo-ACP synthase [Corynebacterium diphtheriae]